MHGVISLPDATSDKEDIIVMRNWYTDLNLGAIQMYAIRILWSADIYYAQIKFATNMKTWKSGKNEAIK